MARFNAIDLSQLAAPPVVEVLDYEDILASIMADFVTRYPDYDVAELESDPAKKVLEVVAYRELLLRARVNDAAKAVMVAFARGADLEHLSALFGVERLVVQEADPDATPPLPEILETDDSLRERTQLSLEAYSTAGPYGGYLFYAISVAGVKDAGVYGPEAHLSRPVTISIGDPCVINWVGHRRKAGQAILFSTTGALPTGLLANTPYYVIEAGLTADTFQIAAIPQGTPIATSDSQSGVHTARWNVVQPGEVAIYPLSAQGNGTPDNALLQEVTAAFSPEDRRPLTDKVLVRVPDIVSYTVDMEIIIGEGPAPETIEAVALAKVQAYVASRHRVGIKVSTAGIAGSAFVAGVEDINLIAPAADIDPGPDAAAFCTGINISVSVIS
ncbi:MAG: baseplate J/gp47 family protein [Bacteroidota bacterium]